MGFKMTGTGEEITDNDILTYLYSGTNKSKRIYWISSQGRAHRI